MEEGVYDEGDFYTLFTEEHLTPESIFNRTLCCCSNVVEVHSN